MDESIRRATPHDASSIAAIAVEVWLGTYLRHGVSEAFADYVLTEHSADAVRARLRSTSHLLWVRRTTTASTAFFS